MAKNSNGEIPHERLELVGETFDFFTNLSVAAVHVRGGSIINHGEQLLFVDGRGNVCQCTVHSMQCDHKPIQQAVGPIAVGIEMDTGVRRRASVYRVTPDLVDASASTSTSG